MVQIATLLINCFSLHGALYLLYHGTATTCVMDDRLCVCKGGKQQPYCSSDASVACAGLADGLKVRLMHYLTNPVVSMQIVAGQLASLLLELTPAPM